MSLSLSHQGQKPVVIQSGLSIKAVTFVATPANDSAFRRRRYAVSTLCVPCALEPRNRPPADARLDPAALQAMPLALADAWTSAHLALWEDYVANSLRRPLSMLTGSGLARLMMGSATINATFAAACMETMTGLGGTTL